VIRIAHHTDRKERVVTHTLAQLRALVVLCADDINAPRRSADESEPSEEAIRRFEALLRELHTAVQSEHAALWRYRSWLLAQTAMAYNAARRPDRWSALRSLKPPSRRSPGRFRSAP
jgi:hypothetical protein